MSAALETAQAPAVLPVPSLLAGDWGTAPSREVPSRDTEATPAPAHDVGPAPARRPRETHTCPGSARPPSRAAPSRTGDGPAPGRPGTAGTVGERGFPGPDGRMLPDPVDWAGSLARAGVEVAVGLRPAAQLSRWMEPDLYDRLSRRAGLAVRILGRPRGPCGTRVRAVRACHPAEGVVEASAVVHDGHRFRAVAMRLEARRGRWFATELIIG